MKKTIAILAAILAVTILINCGGDGAGAGTCAQDYTTADLSGCYEPDNAGGAVMNYYCFDGAGGYRNDGWNAISGCATMHNGQYEVKGCNLKICDDTGCSDHNVVPDNNGLTIDGEHYSDSNGC
jgi:hypothetical protein